MVRNEILKQGWHGRILHEGLSEHLIALADNEKCQYGDTKLTALRDCVDQLPRKSRELVRSRYYEGWNVTVLADKFEMKSATVRQTLLRIRGSFMCVLINV